MDNYCILENSELVTYKIKEIRDKLRVNGDQPISDEYKNLISEYIYSIPPIYTAHSSLNNQQLLLSEVLTVEEYNYFHNYIYNDIINHFSNMKKTDPYADRTNYQYIFTQLNICFDRVNEAIKLFPDIIKMYYKQKNKK